MVVAAKPGATRNRGITRNRGTKDSANSEGIRSHDVEGLTFDCLEVTAKANVDPRVLFGIVPVSEAQSCIQPLDVEVKVTGDVSEEDGTGYWK